MRAAFVPTVCLILLAACGTPSLGTSADARYPVRVGKLCGYIDGRGRMVISPRFLYAGSFREDRAIIVDKDDKYGFIDPSGTLVIPARYDETESFHEGFAWVAKYRQDGEFPPKDWTLVDKAGRERFPPRPYKAVFAVEDGIAWVDCWSPAGVSFRQACVA